MAEPQDMIVLQNFIDILEEMNIIYALGGSMASSVYGKVRFTQDADIIVEPFDDIAEKLFERLKSQYYISKDAMYHALEHQSSFNIIHLESAFKIDVFVRKNTLFEKQVLARRKPLKLSDTLEKRVSMVSPEDIILLKLCWYRDGGCVSQNQWEDVLGVLHVQNEKLDLAYLNKYSAVLKINDLLQKAKLEIE